ncbi:acyl-CoA dehydrogenase family protein [Hyphomonas sp. FCG-A18]|uniref:acyl-CoA dehydrogenase family protein n=1 Tax=Hyphomonas sp. FCG-A18 TaxID=3080019 RepID=UPI002B2B8A64|nr:acyl-CoA dehydrogenase family protein [Hyphomonas sp. FCG-A18]
MTKIISFDSLRPPCPHMDETHEAWRRSVRGFIDREIMPHVEDWEEAGRIPRALYKKASEAGLLGIGYPEAYGGEGTDFDRFHGIVTSEELARIGAGGVSSALMIHGIGLPPIMAMGSEEMKREIGQAVLSGDKQISLGITEPGGGSDVAQLKTKAVKDGNGWRVNGSKTYITGGMTSKWATTAVRTGGEGMGGISLMLIDLESEGVSRTELPKQGWWASDTATLHFDDVFVPAENLIGEENHGFYGIMANFNGERLGMAAQAAAYARVCVEEAAAWAQERKTFGKRLADHQVIRHKLASMAQRIWATTTMLDTYAWHVQNGQTPVAELAMLKVQATETMEYCAREAMQILGGAGFIRGHRVERIYREVRVMAIGGGSEEIMRDLAARQLGV